VTGVLPVALQIGPRFVELPARPRVARVLYFSHNGYWLLSKRLERGRFCLPWDPTEGLAVRSLEIAQLQLILEGRQRRSSCDPPIGAHVTH
jgi:hypothetical protein